MNKCEMYRQQCIDLAYGEGQDSAELQAHLEECQECAEFFAGIKRVQTSLDQSEIEYSPGFVAVKKAMRHAYQAKERIHLITDLLKFASLIIGVLFLYYLLYKWRGVSGVITVQLVFYLVGPLCVIPLTKIQVYKRREQKCK